MIWEVLTAILFGYLSFLPFKLFRRLYFHPLRLYPGPKFAASTTYYKGYYEVIKDGGLVAQLEALHKKYGPVVRIAPDELHFSDPCAFTDIYAMGSKFPKESAFYLGFAEDESSFGFTDPMKAKARREVLSPLFSRRAILKLENVVQEKIDKLVAQLLIFQDPDQPINMSRAFRSVTVDIITAYCFARCTNALDDPQFAAPVLIFMEDALPLNGIFRYFPLLLVVLEIVPEWLVQRLSPQQKGFARLRRGFASQIDDIMTDPGTLECSDHEIVYHHLLTPRGNHPVPSKRSLVEEALNLTFAGSDTVGHTCAMGTFYVLNNKDVHASLLKELDAAWPDKDSPVKYEVLEKLPYLTAVIKESLRMSHGVVSALPRVVGPTDAVVAGRHVPAGTTVSIGATFVHWNPDVFPDPLAFTPERWLSPGARELDHYLVPFSRGPRSCLGINLAWCELYLLFANVFRKLDLQVYDTSVEDFEFKAHFLPRYKRFLHVNHVCERF